MRLRTPWGPIVPSGAAQPLNGVPPSPDGRGGAWGVPSHHAGGVAARGPLGPRPEPTGRAPSTRHPRDRLAGAGRAVPRAPYPAPDAPRTNTPNPPTKPPQPGTHVTASPGQAAQSPAPLQNGRWHGWDPGHRCPKGARGTAHPTHHRPAPPHPTTTTPPTGPARKGRQTRGAGNCAPNPAPAGGAEPAATTPPGGLPREEAARRGLALAGAGAGVVAGRLPRGSRGRRPAGGYTGVRPFTPRRTPPRRSPDSPGATSAADPVRPRQPRRGRPRTHR